MNERIVAHEFQKAAEDWRVLLGGACAYFRTESFAAGVALAEAVAALAADTGLRPDVDLRHDGVTVRLAGRGMTDMSGDDIELARRISAAARGLGLPAEPGAVQGVNVAIDALVVADVLPFWRAVLGYCDGYRVAGPEYLVDPLGRGPVLWFQQMDTPRPQRNRAHVDVLVPYDQAEARVAATIAAGGRLITERYAPAWWVLADPEGNEACVATCLGRD